MCKMPINVLSYYLIAPFSLILLSTCLSNRFLMQCKNFRKTMKLKYRYLSNKRIIDASVRIAGFKTCYLVCFLCFQQNTFFIFSKTTFPLPYMLIGGCSGALAYHNAHRPHKLVRHERYPLHVLVCCSFDFALDIQCALTRFRRFTCGVAIEQHVFQIHSFRR